MYTILSQAHVQSFSMIFYWVWAALVVVAYFACRKILCTNKISFNAAVVIVMIVAISLLAIPAVLYNYGIFTVDTENVKYTIKIDDPDFIELLSDYGIKGYDGDGVFTVIGKEGLN